MIFLIPLSPFRLVKHVLFGAFGLCLAATSCFAKPSLLTVNSTPYDRQMTRVSRVLKSSAGTRADRTSVTRVNQWLANLRAIPYRYSPQWKTPAQVKSAPVADCKGKAIVLYARMRANGATRVRFVIGKRHIADQRTHAWLEWDTKKGTYLLDPTFKRSAQRVSDSRLIMYVPQYAYNGARKYRATRHRRSHAL